MRLLGARGRGPVWLGLVAGALSFSLGLTVPQSDAQSAGPEKKAAAAEKPVRAGHRLAMQINTDDPTTMRAVISTALHLSKYYESRNEPFALEIVAYNAGIHMFRADTSPVRDLLQSLRTVNPSIRFVICDATQLGMERGEGRPIYFLEATQSVPNGPARLIELQETGWSYIRS